MANKTKTELLEEIEDLNKEIKDLKKEVEKLDRYKQYADCTDELAALRESFVNSGFSKTEAFELVKTMLKNACVANSNSGNYPTGKVSYRYYR